MARIFIDGFESGGLDLWDTVGGGSASTTQKRTGSYAYYVSTTAHFLIKNISAISTIYFKFWLYLTSTATLNANLILFLDDVGSQVCLRISTANRLGFMRGREDGTLLAEGSTTLALNTWYLIEGRIFIDGSNGIAQLKLNGTMPLEIDFTGNTRKQTGNTITRVRIGANAYSPFRPYYDDFVLDDSAWIGDTRIQRIVPSGAGSSTEWTPSAGDNWNCVEEIPASDTDFVSTNENNRIDTYAATTITGAGQIKCLQVQARAVKEGTPTPQNIKLALRTYGTNYESGSKAVPASYKSLFNVWETNPYTSAAWQQAEIDDIEIGIKSAA